jgi:hypothetical protein
MTITGGTGDDSITLGSFDKNDSLDLGEGTDTLNVDFSATVSTAATLSNIEKMVVTTNGAYTINLDKATALTEITATAASADAHKTNFTNVASTLKTVNLNGSGATADQNIDDVTINLKDSSGTSDELTVNVVNIDANGAAIVPGKGVQLDADLNANGIETITINSAVLGADTDSTTQDGGARIDITGADALKTLTVTAASTLMDLNDTALSNTVKVVDASGANGGVLLDLSAAADATTVAAGATGSVTVTTGSGNDIFGTIVGTVATSITSGAGIDTFTLAGDMTKTLTINAGAGTDSIDISADTSAIAKKITTGDGVDTIKIAADNSYAASQSTVTVSDFTVGSGGDKLDILSTTNLLIGGTGNTTDYVEIAAVTANTVGGMTVWTGADLATLDGAGLVGALGGGVTNSANDCFLIAADNGTDTSIFMVKDGAAARMDTGAAGAQTADGIIVATEVLEVLTLTGVSDASKLSVDNFTDFLA